MALIPRDEARRYVLDRSVRLPAVETPLREALRLVTAEAVHAADAVPPFDNTAMDGFAVRAADTANPPVVLDIVGELAAGAAPDIEVPAGGAVRIMTGAPVPPGADAIVMVERTSPVDPGKVQVNHQAEVGDHIRRAGEDLAADDLVFSRGDELRPAHIGVLANVGRTHVRTYKRPVVGVLSTGDELVEAPTPLGPGQIRDSNRVALLAALTEAGCEPVDLGLVRDDIDKIEAAVATGAASCDALITSGGVSVGDYDHMKAVLDRLGDMRWMQIAIRPAKPFAFGLIETDGTQTPVFGLPGNPVSSMVSFELFARPALRQMMGHIELDRPHVEAIACDGLARHPGDGKTHFVRVACHRVPGGWEARTAGGQGSHQLTALAHANGLAIVDDGPGVRPGGEVTVMLIDSQW